MSGGEPTRVRFVSQGLALHYCDWGNAGAPTLILQHGGQDHARSWDWVAEKLRDEYHLIAPDLRGHGDSAWSPDGAYATPYFLEDMAALVEAIGVPKVTIVAHSLGGAIALRYAGLYPKRVARIVAIEGIGLVGRRLARTPEERLRGFIEARQLFASKARRTYPSIGAATERMQAGNTRLSDVQARHLTVHGTTSDDNGGLRWKFDDRIRAYFPADMPDEDLRALWGAIDCPAWLVHGAESWAAHPDKEGRAAAFKHAAVTSYAAAAHWVQHDRLDDFVADLRLFLSGGVPPRER